MNALALLRQAGKRGVARQEAVLLLERACDRSLARLLADGGPVDEESLRDFWRMTDERLSGRPLQYILGEWEFMGLSFFVDERALIPRPETELLVSRAVAECGEKGYETALDLCTGSGCIAVCLARFTKMEIAASDISAAALALAEQNASRHGVRAAFMHADLFDGLGVYDMVVCNPPYLRHSDMDAMQRELRYEPASALAGGEDGLDFYRAITGEIGAHLRPRGTLLLEVGQGQAERVRHMMQRAGLARLCCLRDENGIERVVAGSAL